MDCGCREYLHYGVFDKAVLPVLVTIDQRKHEAISVPTMYLPVAQVCKANVNFGATCASFSGRRRRG